MVEVTNSSKSNTTSYEYRFKFDQFPQLDKTIVSTWPTGFHAVKFASTCELKGGNYTVQVDVWKFQLGFPTHSIGTILYTLEVTDCNWIGQSNDGPATLGTQITFIAYNWYRMDYGPPFEYRFKFEQFPEHDKSIVSTKGEVEYIITFGIIFNT
ncbi:uncharacterized protein LOC107369742 [Tetranychus urticae]|uniref:uncharacterized protein LOC107369742 n=1 Tax=Tetranychus urticae TaxID=32264 RepID=UPI000D64756B|nr:uncharacterized protein LOC107369742 [Tetranychus urticae]